MPAADRTPPVQKISFEPHTEDNRLQDKNHSEKINTSTLNDSRGQEREIQVSHPSRGPAVLNYLCLVYTFSSIFDVRFHLQKVERARTAFSQVVRRNKKLNISFESS